MFRTFKCVICGVEEIGYGNNPAPIKLKGRCCEECNIDVIVERCKNLGHNISRNIIIQTEILGREIKKTNFKK